jgi:hypothetical protein
MVMVVVGGGGRGAVVVVNVWVCALPDALLQRVRVQICLRRHRGEVLRAPIMMLFLL